MALPQTGSLVGYGGGLNDFAPVIDPTTDRPASGANVAYSDVAGMTHTAVRAWAQFTWNGSGAPTLVVHDANWGNALGVAPTVVRTGAGLGTVTWPATVANEILVGTPGYTGPQALNLRDGWGRSTSLSTPYHVQIAVTSANVASIAIFASGGSLTDPSGVNFNVFVI